MSASFDNPHRGDPYGGEFEPADVVEPTAVPRWMGVFNILIGGVLLLTAGCCGMQLMFGAATMGQIAQEMQQEFDREFERNIDKQLGELDVAEEDADTGEELEAIEQQRAELEALQPPQMPDLVQLTGLSDRDTLGVVLLHLVASMVLNLAMFVAGIGLLAYRNWGRVVSLWVAGLKLLALVVVCAGMLSIVGPRVARGVQEFVTKIQEQLPAGQVPEQSPAEMAAAIQMSVATGAILALVLGAVYPILTLAMLTRSDVKEACGAKRRDEPWETP